MKEMNSDNDGFDNWLLSDMSEPCYLVLLGEKHFIGWATQHEWPHTHMRQSQDNPFSCISPPHILLSFIASHVKMLSLSLSPSLPIYPFTYFWSIFVIDEGNMHFMLQVVGKWRRLLIAYNFTWFFTKRIQVRISKTNNIDFLQSCKSF